MSEQLSAKERVLQVWPDAKWSKSFGCICSAAYRKSGAAFQNISGDNWWNDEDAAWKAAAEHQTMTAASHLPPKVEEPVVGRGEITDEQKVKAVCPRAYAHSPMGHWWYIDVSRHTPMLGEGKSEAAAWADAASRLPTASPEPVSTPSQPTDKKVEGAGDHEFVSDEKGSRQCAFYDRGTRCDRREDDHSPNPSQPEPPVEDVQGATELSPEEHRRACAFNLPGYVFGMHPRNAPSAEPPAAPRHARIDCEGNRPCGEWNCDYCHPADPAEPVRVGPEWEPLAQDDALNLHCALGIAGFLHSNFYNHVPQWKPMTGDMFGLLSQISNMLAGIKPALSTRTEGVDGFNEGLEAAANLVEDEGRREMSAKDRETKRAEDFERMEQRLAASLEKIDEARRVFKEILRYRPRHSPGCSMYDPTAYCPQCRCGFSSIVAQINKFTKEGEPEND